MNECELDGDTTRTRPNKNESEITKEKAWLRCSKQVDHSHAERCLQLGSHLDNDYVNVEGL